MGQLNRTAARRAGATGAGRRIYELLRGLIADGSLAAGMRVPSTRAMAADQGVSRTTVTVAYEQLVAEGYLVTSAGRVARVTHDLAVPMPPGTRASGIKAPALRLSAQGRRVARLALPPLPPEVQAPLDFLYGAVAPADFPAQAWRRAYQAELAGRKQHDYYAPPEGELALRRVLQGYLRRARGLPCEADQIVIVNGSQQGIDLCARLLLDAGRCLRLRGRLRRRVPQATLAALIASGAYERHVRRLRRDHERRRAAVLQAIARHLPAPVQVAGDAAGLHLVLWLPRVHRRDEAALVAAARRHGVGVHPVAPLYAARSGRHVPRCAGLVVGYAPLSPLQIDQGMGRLGEVLAGHRSLAHETRGSETERRGGLTRPASGSRLVSTDA